MDGIINIYKEKGYTSHDVVAKMRGILKMKKIGHTGTLDPDAEGVLPVCIGKGTRLSNMITDRDKTYIAKGRLGITTDTQDSSGRIIKTVKMEIESERFEQTAKSFLGEYQQLPPMYSAVKIAGKRLYEYARQGIEPDRKPRSVMIKEIHFLDFSKEKQEFKIMIACGKGTYIRTLINDIGEKLGCGAVMTDLIRTAAGKFTLENALKLSELERIVRENRLLQYLITIEEIFQDYPKLTIFAPFDKLVHNGNELPPEAVTSPERLPVLHPVRIYDSQSRFIGIYQYNIEKERYRPVKMFL